MPSTATPINLHQEALDCLRSASERSARLLSPGAERVTEVSANDRTEAIVYALRDVAESVDALNQTIRDTGRQMSADSMIGH